MCRSFALLLVLLGGRVCIVAEDAVWRKSTFEDFADGRFSDHGAKCVVSLDRPGGTSKTSKTQGIRGFSRERRCSCHWLTPSFRR